MSYWKDPDGESVGSSSTPDAPEGAQPISGKTYTELVDTEDRRIRKVRKDARKQRHADLQANAETIWNEMGETFPESALVLARSFWPEFEGHN